MLKYGETTPSARAGWPSEIICRNDSKAVVLEDSWSRSEIAGRGGLLEPGGESVDRLGKMVSRGRMPLKELSVSSPLDFDLKERVRAAADIVDVLGESLELRPQGSNYVALCPFHNDTRPSLTVNTQRQTWKCWPCDKGGDVFSFVQARDGVGFGEALRILAERAGIEMPRQGGPRAEPGSPRDKATLLAAMKFACDAFFRHLESGHGEEVEAARAYMTERQIDDASRQHFRIGYAPSSFRWLLDRANREGFSAEVLEAAGLVIQRDNNTYDRFRGRLMFPICDLQDRPISAGGRILPSLAEQQKANAKYINGPESLLFSKSRQLYGLNHARQAVLKSREVFVMEGYTDVVAAWQTGIEPVVAVLGTALGEGHIQLIRRFADRVVLVLDGDQAGRNRADEVLELFVRADVDLRVMTLPEGMDPADFLQHRGRPEFESLATEAPDAIEHKLTTLLDGVDLATDTHRAAKALETILGILAKAPHQRGDLRTDQILLRLSRQFTTSKANLEARLKQLRIESSKRRRGRTAKPTANATVRRPPAAATDPNALLAEAPDDAAGDDFASADQSVAPEVKASPWAAIDGIDRELFEILIECPELAPQAIENIDPAWLKSDAARKIMECYQELDLAGRSLDVQSLLLALEEESAQSTIVSMDDRVQRRREHLTASPEERYREVQRRYQQRQWNVQREQHLAVLESAAVSDDEATALLRDLFEGEKARKGLLNRPSRIPAKATPPETPPEA